MSTIPRQTPSSSRTQFDLSNSTFSARPPVPTAVCEFKDAVMQEFSNNACGLQFHHKGWLIGLYQSDKNPRTDTASCTKSVVAIAIFKASELGYLQLDDKVSKYLPPWEHLKPLGYENVTIRHLLTHTSGIPGNKYFLPKNRKRFVTGDEQFFTGLARYEGLDRNLRASLWPVMTKPGEKYDYSNPGTQLLAAALAQALPPTSPTQTVRQFVHEQIFVPLGMRDTTLTDDKQVTQFNGGMISTADDLARLGHFIVDGLNQAKNPILKRSTLQQMLSTPKIKGCNPQYAHLWHRRTNPDVIRAIGDRENLVIALPKQGIVISRTQHHIEGMSDNQCLEQARIFWEKYNKLMKKFIPSKKEILGNGHVLHTKTKTP